MERLQKTANLDVLALLTDLDLAFEDLLVGLFLVVFDLSEPLTLYELADVELRHELVRNYLRSLPLFLLLRTICIVLVVLLWLRLSFFQKD